MRAEVAHLVRVAKRLTEASGYLELGLTARALDCLEGLEPHGPFEAGVALIRGEALRLEHRYADAAAALKVAAAKVPAPHDKSAWLALSLCFGQAGNLKQAIQMLARARGAK